MKNAKEVKSLITSPINETKEDIFKEDASIDNSSDNWETGDVGEFEVVKLKDEGDSWVGHIIKDCEEKGLPEWLPDGFDNKIYETLNVNGQKGIIAKYYRLVQYVEKYGSGMKIMYKVVRGKKAGNKQTDFVNFEIKFRHIV